MKNETAIEKNPRAVFLLVILLVFTSFFGFYRSYFVHFPWFTETSWVVHFHVATILCWFAMLIIQATLAKSGRIALHKKVGRLSYVLVPFILLGFAMVTNFGQLRQKAPDLLGATLFDASLFLLFYLLAIKNRRRTKYHARYMMLSALPFINPGLGRFINPGVSLTVEFLILLGLFLTAYFQKKPYQPYLVGLCAFFVMLGVIVYISFIKPVILETVWSEIWG